MASCAHNNPLNSKCYISSRPCCSTARLSYPTGSGDQISCHLRLKMSALLQRGDYGRFLPNSGTSKCQRDSLVLFMFATKMATESAVAEILWLTSAVCAVCAVNAVRSSTATPAGDGPALHARCISSHTVINPCGHKVSLLHW